VSGFDGIVYRAYNDNVVDPAVTNERLLRYSLAESRRFLQDIWATVDCAWFPGSPTLIAKAQNKILQLDIAARLGFSLPPTLVTNDPSQLQSFWQEHDGQLISKLPSEIYFNFYGKSHARYTEPVTHWDLAAIHSASISPVMYQKTIQKKQEIRATVVGENIYATAIGSQISNRTRLDWRHYDRRATPHDAIVLPPLIAQRCVDITHRLGINFGAIDLIETPEGDHVFLEINPAGQWGWIEGASGLPITEAVGALIVSECERRREGRSDHAEK
jgi:glutathione synthase/RimK-type ligase-like ATP-grasp enzyme